MLGSRQTGQKNCVVSNTFSKLFCGKCSHVHTQVTSYCMATDFFVQKLVAQQMECSETSILHSWKVCGWQMINVGKWQLWENQWSVRNKWKQNMKVSHLGNSISSKLKVFCLLCVPLLCWWENDFTVSLAKWAWAVLITESRSCSFPSSSPLLLPPPSQLSHSPSVQEMSQMASSLSAEV